MKREKKLKQIRMDLSREIHSQFKVLCVVENMTMKDLFVKMLELYTTDKENNNQ